MSAGVLLLIGVPYLCSPDLGRPLVLEPPGLPRLVRELGAWLYDPAGSVKRELSLHGTIPLEADRWLNQQLPSIDPDGTTKRDTEKTIKTLERIIARLREQNAAPETIKLIEDDLKFEREWLKKLERWKR
jgi:hypothetical protein